MTKTPKSDSEPSLTPVKTLVKRPSFVNLRRGKPVESNRLPISSDAPLLVGRDEDCDICITNHENEVAPVHLKLSVSKGGVEAVSVSNLPTFLNKKQIPQNKPVRLNEKDVVTIAAKEFLFEYAEMSEELSEDGSEGEDDSHADTNADSNTQLDKKAKTSSTAPPQQTRANGENGNHAASNDAQSKKRKTSSDSAADNQQNKKQKVQFDAKAAENDRSKTAVYKTPQKISPPKVSTAMAVQESPELSAKLAEMQAKVEALVQQNQKITDEHTQRLQGLEKKTKEMEQENNATKKKLEALKKEFEAVKKELDATKTALDNAKKSLVETQKALTESQKTLKDTQQQNVTLKEQATELQSELEMTSTENVNLTLQNKQLQEKIVGIENNIKVKQKRYDEQAQAISSISALFDKLNKLNNSVETDNNRVLDLNQKKSLVTWRKKESGKKGDVSNNAMDEETQLLDDSDFFFQDSQSSPKRSAESTQYQKNTEQGAVLNLNHTEQENNSAIVASLVGFADKQAEGDHVEYLTRLGAQVISNGQNVPDNLTHIIDASPKSPTIRVLMGTLRHLWIMSPDWVIESFRAGHFLPEEQFGKKSDADPIKGHKIFVTASFRNNSSTQATACVKVLALAGGAVMADNIEESTLIITSQNEQIPDASMKNRICLDWHEFVDLVLTKSYNNSSNNNKNHKKLSRKK